MNGLVNAGCSGDNNARKSLRCQHNNLWELVTPTAGEPRQMPRSPHIPGDIYRWGSQLGSVNNGREVDGVQHHFPVLSVAPMPPSVVCAAQLPGRVPPGGPLIRRTIG